MLCKASPRRKFYIGSSNDITKKQKPEQKRATAAQGSSKVHDPPPPPPRVHSSFRLACSGSSFLPSGFPPTATTTNKRLYVFGKSNMLHTRKEPIRITTTCTRLPRSVQAFRTSADVYRAACYSCMQQCDASKQANT